MAVVALHPRIFITATEHFVTAAEQVVTTCFQTVRLGFKKVRRMNALSTAHLKTRSVKESDSRPCVEGCVHRLG